MPLSIAEVLKRSPQESLLELLDTMQQAFTLSEIKSETGLGRRQLYWALNALKEKGAICTRRVNKLTYYFSARALTEKGGMKK